MTRRGECGGLVWRRESESGLNCPERFICILNRSNTSWLRGISIRPFKQDSLPCLVFCCCASTFLQVLFNVSVFSQIIFT